MKCPKCRAHHKDTRVTCTERCSDHNIRYCRCLKCGTKWKTEEKIVKYKERFIPSSAKLNVDKVKLIRKVAEDDKEQNIEKDITMLKLSMLYGVEIQTIKNVIARKTWKNIN